MANLIVKLPSFLVLLFKHFLHLKKMHVIFKNQFSDQVSYMHAGLKKNKSLFNLLAAPDLRSSFASNLPVSRTAGLHQKRKYSGSSINFWSRKFPRSLLLTCAHSLGEIGTLPFMF